MNYNEFSIMVNNYIKEQGLTVVDLAEGINISAQCLLKIINADNNIPINILKKVAAFFKMQLKIQIK